MQSSLRNIMERGRAYKSPSEHWSVFCLLSSEFASRGRRGVFCGSRAMIRQNASLNGSQGFLPSISIQQILTVLHQTFTFLFLLHAIIRRLCNVSVLTRDRACMVQWNARIDRSACRSELAPFKHKRRRVHVRIRVQSHAHNRHDPRLPPPRPPHRSLENGKVNPNTISWADARSSSENPQCTSYAKIRHDRIGVPHMRTSVTTLVSPPRPPHPSKMGRSTQSFLGGRGGFGNGFGELAPKSVETADTAEASLERCAARSNCG